MSDDEPTPPTPGPPAPDGQAPRTPDGWVPPAPPPPRGGWAPPDRGDPQPYAASYVPQPGYAYGPPPPGSVQPTYQPGLGTVQRPAARGERLELGRLLLHLDLGALQRRLRDARGVCCSAFVPFGDLVWAIVCGVNGNRWAWQGKPWTSVEQFRSAQRKWAVAALIVFLVAIVALILLVIFAAGHASGSRGSTRCRRRLFDRSAFGRGRRRSVCDSWGRSGGAA